MLRGISPLLTPDLLAALWRMGHGDTVVLCDAHFPAASLSDGSEHRLDSAGVVPLAGAILELLALDSYDSPAALMAPEPGDSIDETFRGRLMETISPWLPTGSQVRMLSRRNFYGEAAQAQVVVATGETATYANVILRKGVTPATA
ncbi:MAG: fucose isomerase [Acidimicrobiaceae bacterium]|nr:fucose isomerase [Acidimicrobiaceae bacterium]MCY4279862.1 fucose isomerase [Acidimicrobiaceae bacterium]MCY4293255.1 fucose isomerase [Acidimicrobiaceae bacterium]